MSQPLVSIIIPSFNQGKYIRETIESCLNQDYRPLEVLVLDGGSIDETITILKSFSDPELVWWSEPDEGVVDAVNKGLKLARGDILTIQSSDDVFLPGAISAAVQMLAENPSAGLVYGDVQHIDANSRLIGEDVQGAFNLGEYLGRLIYIPQPGACFTRSALKLAGGWRTVHSYVADADFWMRVATKLPVVKLNRLVGQYRYHEDQRDKQRERIAQDWNGAVKDLLAGDSLNARQRKHARMGIYLAWHRYTLESDWWFRTRMLYAALAANPVAFFDPRIQKKELLFGRTPLWRKLSLIKRFLGLKPRTNK